MIVKESGAVQTDRIIDAIRGLVEQVESQSGERHRVPSSIAVMRNAAERALRILVAQARGELLQADAAIATALVEVIGFAVIALEGLPAENIAVDLAPTAPPKPRVH